MANYDDAIAVVNQLQDDMANLARTVYNALEDDRISTMEGIRIAMSSVSLGTRWLGQFQSMSQAELTEILYVLENMDIVLPSGE
jgi:hypothetical protein